MSTDLPNGWFQNRLDAITTDIQYGYTVSADSASGGPRLLRITDIQDGLVNWNTVPGCSIDGKNLDKYRLYPGDIVFARSGATTGKSFLINHCPNDAVFASYLIRVRANRDAVEPSFLRYFFQSSAYWGYITEHLAGNAQPNCNGSKLAALPIPTPPVAEQRRIVAYLEEHLSDLDAGVVTLKHVRANLTRYRVAVLKAAVEGRLIPEEVPFAAKADDMLRDIARLRATTFPKSDGGACRSSEAPHLIPETWRWVAIDALLTAPMCNGLSVKGSNAPPGVRALRLSALAKSGFDYGDVRFLPVAWDDVADIAIQAGDFFVSRGNGSLDLVGRGTLAAEPPAPTVFPDTMIRMRLHPDVREWIAAIWESRFVRAQIERRVKTTAGIFKMSQSELASIVVPLPPASERRNIVSRIRERVASVEALARDVITAEGRAARLRQSILKRAFEGRIVPQEGGNAAA